MIGPPHSKPLGDRVFDLAKFHNVYVMGGGKAAGAMAEALEQVMGDRISDGTMNIPYSAAASTRIIELHEAMHPLPDESGIEGTKRYLKSQEKPKRTTL